MHDMYMHCWTGGSLACTNVALTMCANHNPNPNPNPNPNANPDHNPNPDPNPNP